MKIPAFLMIGILALLCSCGGGGSSSTNPITNPPPTSTPQSFTITTSPSTSQANPLQISSTGTSLTVTVTGQNGFSGQVGLAFTGLPSGVAATPSNWTSGVGQPQAVTFAATSNAPTSTFDAKITGTSGTLTNTVDLFGKAELPVQALKWVYAVSPVNSGFQGIAADMISGFQVNSSTGSLTQLQGFPLNLGLIVDRQMAIDPQDRFLFLTEDAADGVGVFQIDRATGALTQVSGSPFASGSGVQTPVVDPTGTFLFVTNNNSTDGNSIAVFRISSTGTLAPVTGSPFLGITDLPFGAAVDPKGRFLYVSNLGSTTVGAVGQYAIDGNTGALSLIGPFAVCPFCRHLAVDPTGRFLYGTGQDLDSNVYAAAIDPNTGGLAAIPGSPFSVFGVPGKLVVSPDGKFLFAADVGGPALIPGNLWAFTIDSASGALSLVSGSPFMVGNGPGTDLAIDPSGRFLYVTNISSVTVSVVSVDPNRGFLTVVSTAPAASGNGIAGPADIVVTH